MVAVTDGESGAVVIVSDVGDAWLDAVIVGVALRPGPPVAAIVAWGVDVVMVADAVIAADAADVAVALTGADTTDVAVAGAVADTTDVAAALVGVSLGCGLLCRAEVVEL